MFDKLVVDDLQAWAKREIKVEPWGDFPLGKALMGAPEEMELILDFTGLRGSGANIYKSFVFRLGKWRYFVAKVDEFMEVNPNYTELYNVMVAQKQRLEGAIKTGLTSVANAVADYELMQHDLRRYREIINYFRQGQKDEHVLRSLFVDRVDVYTGEGYSMVTMAKRWPTIITDFIRMKSEWTDIDTIKRELDVSQAEATVLKTKNELYKEWKQMFFPVVKERLARLETLVKARKKSVEEYRKWLKPYITKYKAMRETSEKALSYYISDPFSTPAFGTSDALTGTRIWCWIPLSIVEKRKMEALREVKGKGTNFVIDPYDDIVKEWKKRIEEKYKVEITDEEVRDILENAVRKSPQAYCSQMDPAHLYYIFFDIFIVLNTLKTPPPEGLELDNIMFIPINIWYMSHNILLIHILEIYAREKAMIKYINEIIGTEEIEKEEAKKIEALFEEKKEEKKNETWEKTKKKLKIWGEKFAYFFIKPGPYETIFFERVSKAYSRGGGKYWKQMIDFLKELMQIE